MTLPRKRSRPITVNDVGYRWLLKETCRGAGPELLLVIESSELRNGEQLVARIEERHLQVNNPLTPKLIASFIEEACSAGWRPERKGSCPPCSDELLQHIRANTDIARHF